MRTTLAKQVSQRDYARAQLIAEALWTHREGRGLGNAYMAVRVLRLPWRTVADKVRAARRIYDLMDTVQRIITAEHPGYVVERRGNSLARLVAEPDCAARQAIPRLHRLHTMLRRADAECEAIRLTSTSPTQHELAAGVRVLLNATQAQIAPSADREAARLNDQAS